MLRDWLRYAVTRFGEANLAFGHGTANAYDEAAYLLLHALSLPLDRLEPFLDARLTLAEQADIAALLSRRIDERIPAAYLTGEAWLGDFGSTSTSALSFRARTLPSCCPMALRPTSRAPTPYARRSIFARAPAALRSSSRTRTRTPISTLSIFRRTRWRLRSTTSAITNSPAESTWSALVSSTICATRPTTSSSAIRRT